MVHRTQEGAIKENPEGDILMFNPRTGGYEVGKACWHKGYRIREGGSLFSSEWEKVRNL